MSARHWTREEIARELKEIAGGTIAYGATGGDPVGSARNFLDAVVIRDLLAERDAMTAAAAELAPAPKVTYRLPDWLGGHPVRIERRLEGGGMRVWVPDHESTTIEITSTTLVEVRPPSIDDPVEVPLEIDTPAWTLRLRHRQPSEGGTGTVLEVENRNAYSKAGLDVDDLRRLARACWQCANAVESIAPGGDDHWRAVPE